MKLPPRPAPDLVDERIIDQNTGKEGENDDYTNIPQAVQPNDNNLVEEAKSGKERRNSVSRNVNYQSINIKSNKERNKERKKKKRKYERKGRGSKGTEEKKIEINF